MRLIDFIAHLEHLRTRTPNGNSLEVMIPTGSPPFTEAAPVLSVCLMDDGDKPGHQVVGILPDAVLIDERDVK